jgi:SAM-dependent methyltransferase
MGWDPVWEEIFSSQAWGKYPEPELIRFIARNFYKVKERNRIKILEVGSGPGANLWYMALEGFSVYGIDGSEKAVELSRRRLNAEQQGWSGEIRCGDISVLDFVENTFDAVIDHEAVYANSFDNAKLIYSEMARVLKPGGKFFSRTFAVGTWGDQTGEKLGYNAYAVAEGPMQGKGYTRFTSFGDIRELIDSQILIESIETVSRTLNERTANVIEWIILGEKQ